MPCPVNTRRFHDSRRNLGKGSAQEENIKDTGTAGDNIPQVRIDQPNLGQNHIRRDIGGSSRHNVSHHDQGYQQSLSPETDIRQGVGKHCRIGQYDHSDDNCCISAVPHIHQKGAVRQSVRVIIPLRHSRPYPGRHRPDLLLCLNGIGEHPQKRECQDHADQCQADMDEQIFHSFFSSHNHPPNCKIRSSSKSLSLQETRSP